jgi:hypothetical protein
MLYILWLSPKKDLTNQMEHSHFQKLLFMQLVKKFPTLSGSLRFNAKLTTAYHFFSIPSQLKTLHTLPYYFFAIHVNMKMPDIPIFPYRKIMQDSGSMQNFTYISVNVTKRGS